MLRRALTFGAVASCAAMSVSVLVNCFTDTRGDEPVVVVGECDLTKLAANPSPQAAVKVYVETAEELAAAATKAAQDLQKVCTDATNELGLGAGTDVVSACQPLIQRAGVIRKLQPPNDLPVPVYWLNVGAGAACTVDDTVRAACVGTCGGACDLSKCEPGKLQGVCNGSCSGTCTSTGSGVCRGSCKGKCSPFLLDFCVGECVGKCTGTVFQATCAGGCSTDFKGTCKGTCTGTCGGKPINQDAVDAGGDGGKGPPPTNADGNCKAICEGQCSSEASGACGAGCSGNHESGLCLGLCTGDCMSGTGATCAESQYAPDGSPPPTCEGTCTAATGDAGAPCQGICNGTCTGGYKSGQCNGRLDCGQNLECELACQAKATIQATCTLPTQIEVEAITDTALYAILRKYGAQLFVASQRANTLRAAAGLIAERRTGDFLTIGAKGDLVRACVARGNTAVKNANVTIKALTNADITIAQ